VFWNNGSITGFVFDGALDFEIDFSIELNSFSLFILHPPDDFLRRAALPAMQFTLKIPPNPIRAAGSTHLPRQD
jgi:hypothetical protein